MNETLPSEKPSRWISWVILLVLLIMPSLAIQRIAVIGANLSWGFVAGALLVMSLITFFVYWRDKRRAETNRWRIPELTLHLLELIGGWPGAFIAQRLLHHKSSKFFYQIVFWLIVALHQYISLEILNGWSITRRILLAVGP